MSGSITILIPTFNRVRALEAVWPSYLVHPDVARIARVVPADAHVRLGLRGHLRETKGPCVAVGRRARDVRALVGAQTGDEGIEMRT